MTDERNNNSMTNYKPEVDCGYVERNAIFYVFPVVVVLGVVGNLLTTAVVFRNRNARNSAAGIYVIVMATVTVVSLVTRLFRVVVSATGGSRRCSWSSVLFDQISSPCVAAAWLLAALSVERLLTVRKPEILLCRRFRSPTSAAAIATALVLVSLGADLRWLRTNDEDDGGTIAHDCLEYDVPDTRWWINLFIERGLPVCILTATNIQILFAQVHMCRQRSSLSPSTSEYNAFSKDSVSSTTFEIVQVIDGPENTAVATADKMATSICLCASGLFAATSLLCVPLLLVKYEVLVVVDDRSSCEFTAVFVVLFFVVVFLPSTFDVFVFAFASPDYRMELKGIVACGRRPVGSKGERSTLDAKGDESIDGTDGDEPLWSYVAC